MCPACRTSLDLSAVSTSSGRVVEGTLTCRQCGTVYPIVRSIPRFVPIENYASGFGLQWLKHARTQYDSESGLRVSEERFFDETKWGRTLTGETILEIGCGSGRFTEQAVATGATVVSVDYSYAVEANDASNGHHPNLLIVQADIYALPFRPRSFDKAFCIGVLQHTPDVKRSFMSIPPMLAPGGSMVVDVYKKPKPHLRWFYTKYWVRPLVRGLDPATLYRGVERYITFMWPLARLIRRLPFGVQLNWWLLIADYGKRYELDDTQLLRWAILDTFDMLAPAYDLPQTLETFRSWFVEAGLENIDVHYGYNGIEGRATTPAA